MIEEFRQRAEEAFYKSAPNHAAFSLQYHEGTFADPRASVSVGWYMEHDGKHYNAYDEMSESENCMRWRILERKPPKIGKTAAHKKRAAFPF